MQNPYQHLQVLLARYPVLESIRDDIDHAYRLLELSYRQGGKLLICGNGGSAADSEHIVGELMKSFLRKRPINPDTREKLINTDAEFGSALAEHLEQPLPAISLLSHAALGSAFSNDVDGELMFAQKLYGYASPGDVLLGISTSGNSRNVCSALVLAKVLGLSSIGLTGQSGGRFNELCTVTIRVPDTETARIQELHLPVYHTLCAMLEERFFSESAAERSDALMPGRQT